MISPVTTDEQRRIVAERAPLEARRDELLRELREVNRQIAAVGLPSVTRAAIRFIADHPGALTSEVVGATGICRTLLSHLVERGRLRNERAGRSRRWYLP